jgi:ABC-type molybdate transport system ATPase subunit
MITPLKKHLYIYQGSTFKLEHIVKDTAGLAVDLTGATIQSQIREYKASPDVLLDLADTGSVSIVDALAGKILINISAYNTSLIEVEKSVYDLEVHFANGEVYRVLEGSIFMSPEVTRL